MDVGDLITPDGRAHPITGLTSLDEFTGSAGAVGITPTPSPATSPTYNPGGVVNPGGAGTSVDWGSFINAGLSYLNAGGGTAAGANVTTPGNTPAPDTSGTHFGVPHLGIRLIVAIVGIGILLLVVARLVFRD
jgi:hypothetical protein